MRLPVSCTLLAGCGRCPSEYGSKTASNHHCSFAISSQQASLPDLSNFPCSSSSTVQIKGTTRIVTGLVIIHTLAALSHSQKSRMRACLHDHTPRHDMWHALAKMVPMSTGKTLSPISTSNSIHAHMHERLLRPLTALLTTTNEASHGSPIRPECGGLCHFSCTRYHSRRRCAVLAYLAQQGVL
jgi:hypothetical protein